MLQQPGTELKRSKYRLLGLVGQGQFGQVFCAVHRQTGRLVALKNLEQDRFPTHKFLRELRFLLSLQHPNIVTFQSLEHTSTGRYLVMDYCEGGTLRSLLTEETRLSLPHSIQAIMDVLAGLEQAHSRGIVHCDIKPENILLHVHSAGWTARISDFGIARLSQEISYQDGNTGSPAYMAPERFYGQYSTVSDLYSIGILLFELITGHRPFSGTPDQLRSAHLNAPVKLPESIPLVWHSVLLRALQKLPARRFRSAAEMRAEIDAIAVIEKLTLPTEHPVPIFLATADSIECPFQPQHQEEQPEKIVAMAASVLNQDEPCAVSPPPATFERYHASARQLWTQAFWSESFSPVRAAQTPVQIAETSTPITHLLSRPQGCFVISPQSVEWLAVQDQAVQDQAVQDQAVQDQSSLLPLETIAIWTEPHWVTIAPQGQWLAAATAETLKFIALPGQKRVILANQPIPLAPFGSLDQIVSLLALDSRYLAIVTTDASGLAPITDDHPSKHCDGETQIQIVTRRGNNLGSLSLSLRLQRAILTLKPYQLLATEGEQTETVLLVDLKPHRVKRLWVGIQPQLLAATGWGYIVADIAGRMVFLDQAGRLIGTLHSPAPITAMTTVQQHSLLLATWTGKSSRLYMLDLRSVGLDLVF